MKKEVKLKIIIFLLLISFLISIYFVFAFYNKYKELKWPCKPLSCKNEKINITTLIEKNYYNYTLKTITNAQDYIYLAMFQFKFYENLNRVMEIANALIKAKQKGVKVKILLDRSDWNKEIEEKNKQMLNYLKANGIEVKFDLPSQTLHAKFIVIDDKIVIIGSTNLVYYALYSNIETNVAIESKEIAKEFRTYFEFLWEKS